MIYFFETASSRQSCGVKKKVVGTSNDFLFGLRKEIERELQYFPEPSTLKEAYILAMKSESHLHLPVQKCEQPKHRVKQ